MTTKKSSAKTTKRASKTTSNVPEGFVPLRQRLDGFFEREPGNTVTGVLKGTFTVSKGKFGPRRVFRIQLTEPGTITNDGEVLEAGMVVGLDETGYTKCLGDVEPGTAVFVRYEGKAGDAKEDHHVFTVAVAESSG